MYQALYRKWRPQTFDEVTGQSHITDTLKTQVASSRLSHAYLFTGTRGTGKTTCAKILARAVNCEHPVDGNPCNQCPACRGILDGSILDVLELDAASNNGVDQVRALRDEAAYAPAAVKKRVYIIDEVHMLTPRRLQRPAEDHGGTPEHLMFILATTELHKVPATILSRCQRFSFKRILPEDIVNRLEYVASQEGIDLPADGAALLARLADGGMRDALSLLDQCAVGGGTIDRARVLDTLGLAGNLKTAHIFNAIRKGDAGAAITQFGELYAAGKDVTAVLGELTSLSRDLLIRQTAPAAGLTLMAGGYDEATLSTLAKKYAPGAAHRHAGAAGAGHRGLQALGQQPHRGRNLPHPAVRPVAGRLQRRTGRPDRQAGSSGGAGHSRPGFCPGGTGCSAGAGTAPSGGSPPWDDTMPPTPDDSDAPPMEGTPDIPAPAASAPKPTPKKGPVNTGEWPKLVTAMRGAVKMPAYSFLKKADSTVGIREGNVLTIYCIEEFVYDIINKPEVLTAIADVASAQAGIAVEVKLHKGAPSGSTAGGTGAEAPAAKPKPVGSMADLKQFMQQHQS